MIDAHYPDNWQLRPLGAVCEKTPLVNPERAPDQTFNYVDVSSVSNESFSIVTSNELLGKDAPSRARKLIRTDDIIFATVRPTLKRVALVPPKLDGQVCSTGYCVLRVKREELEPQFAYYYLLTEHIARRVDYLQKGATYPAISDSDLFAETIPLPPLTEQRAIARALRTVQEAKGARRRELALERERKAALMQHLFTHGTRGEPVILTEIGPMPESWRVVRLGEACEFLQYGTSELCNADETGIPVLRIPNVIGGKIDISDLKYLWSTTKTLDSLNLTPGDLLFVRTNGRREYTGRCAVYKGELPAALFASYLIRARLRVQQLLPDYLQSYTATGTGQAFLSGRASPTADGKFNINTQTIRSVPVPQAPLDEQQTISRILDSCESKIRALEREATLHDELFRAMLEELMTGRLSSERLIGQGNTNSE